MILPGILTGWRKYFVVAIVATSVAALLLTGRPFVLIFGLIAISAFASGYLLFRAGNSVREGLQALTAALSILGLLIGGYWYFVERRGIPKVNVEPELQAWPIANGLVLVRAEVNVSNVGVIAIRLDKSVPVEIELGQVYPPAGRQAGQLIETALNPAKVEAGLAIAQTDRWPLRASNYEGIDSLIEAGESEKLYFKAVIPCEDNMVLALTAKVPKELSWFERLFEPASEPNYWIAQNIAEVKAICQR